MSLKQSLNEVGLLTVFVVIVVSFLINFNPTIGQVYSGILQIASFALIFFLFAGSGGHYFQYFVKNNNSWLNSIITIGVAVIAFQILSGLIFGFFSLPSQSVFGNVQASAPVLSDNNYIQFFTFGVMIPFIETLTFFVLLLDVLNFSFAKVSSSFTNVSSIVIILLLSAVFTWYHLQAKLAVGQSALIQTFVFAIISLVLVIVTGQAFEAVMFHVFINSWATKDLLFSTFIGPTFSAPLIVSAVIIGYFVVKSKKFSLS